MKKIFIGLIGFILLFPSLSRGENGYYSLSFACLTYVKGDVFVQRGDNLGYEEATINLALTEGDQIETEEGQAEIHFGRKNFLRLASFTRVDLRNLPQRNGDKVKIFLSQGDVYLRVNFLEIERGFEVHTPDASFYIMDEGLYRLRIGENEETELFVHSGEVEASGEEDSLLVRSKERLVVSNGYFISEPTYFNSVYEDFDRWNDSREALYASRVSRSYLPSEISEYEEELADHGRWVYERPYGYVWVPFVSYVDWRPYLYGRWVWYPIIGWTWVSSEPWGWAVYHFGRWHWRIGLGWYWIPTTIWGPAWVHWWSGYDYVAWCPLSWYNTPVVIINNYFYDRYYRYDCPLNSRALVVVHRNQLQSPHLSRVVLNQANLSRLGKISLQTKKPVVQPLLKPNSLRGASGAKVLSKPSLRQMNRQGNLDNRGLSQARSRSSNNKGSSGTLHPSLTYTEKPKNSPSVERKSFASFSGLSKARIREYEPQEKSKGENPPRISGFSYQRKTSPRPNSGAFSSLREGSSSPRLSSPAVISKKSQKAISFSWRPSSPPDSSSRSLPGKITRKNNK